MHVYVFVKEEEKKGEKRKREIALIEARTAHHSNYRLWKQRK